MAADGMLPDGTLLRRGEEGYEEAREAAIWNARKPRRFPAAIALVKSERDVVAAVRLAREEGLPVSIRSGGHSWFGNCLRESALLIDLSALHEVTVDPEAGLATVQPAVRGLELNDQLAAHGLFFPTGHAPTVGIGGFILGGGYGWNSRTLGPACLSIAAIDVVLADGELVHADDESHPDLMWAARGCGPGFFGIVTRYHLRLHPRTPIFRRVLTYPMELHDEILGWALELEPQLPREVEMSVKVGWSAVQDTPAISVAAVGFPPDGEGEALLEPLGSCPVRPRALTDSFGETSLAELYAGSDRWNEPGLRWEVDGIWVDAPTDQVVAAAATAFDPIPDEHAFVLWMLWGHHPPRADACWSVQAPLYLSPNAGWRDAADDEVNEGWVDRSITELSHLSRGVQFSDANFAARPDRGLTVENAEQVEEIRRRYDPDGLFNSYLTAETAAGVVR
ncbi:MAG: FAD-binding oxidoreductase [Solirubrobacterales bacterium]